MIRLADIIKESLNDIINESYNSNDIVVGSVNLNNKEVVGSTGWKTHGYMLNDIPWKKIPRGDWRFNNVNNTLYWWDNNIPREAKIAVYRWLKKNGYIFLYEKIMGDSVETSRERQKILYHSHGGTEFKHSF